MARLGRTLSNLWEAEPCTDTDRRPPRPLTDIEKRYGFQWRLLCDAAFQQDTEFNFSSIYPPLCAVDFCWKSYNYHKWSEALSILRVKINKVDATPTEEALLWTPIKETMYADRSKHAHIQAVEKIVSDLRKAYDSDWMATDTGTDQRCIFALCTTELCYGKGHANFAHTFEQKCRERGFELSEAGHYQKRLHIFRSMQQSDDFAEGLGNPYHSMRWDDPNQFEAEKGLPLAFCSKQPMCFKTYDSKGLLHCSRCKIAKYVFELLLLCLSSDETNTRRATSLRIGCKISSVHAATMLLFN